MPEATAGDRSRGHHAVAERIRAIDPLRGFAMVLVVAQHAYHFVDPVAAVGLANAVVYGVTRMASVAFMAISGMMISYFLHSGRPPAAVVARYRRRALFLLVFAHPAIHVARLFNVDEPGAGIGEQLVHRLLFELPITDTIALCLLLAPPILLRLSVRAVAGLSVALLVATQAVLAVWQPEGVVARALGDLLFGPMSDDPVLDVGWPLVPWLAIFLLGSLAGGWLGDARRGAIALPRLVARLLRVAAALFATGVVLMGAGRLLRGAYGPALGPFLTELLSPDRTTALLPAYLAILAALLAALLVYADGKGRYDRLLWALSVLGRTSLFTYVIQFVFVHSVPAWLGLKGTLDLGGTVALAAGATLLTWLCAYAYGRGRGWLGPDDYGSLRRLGGASPLGGGGVAAGAG